LTISDRFSDHATANEEGAAVNEDWPKPKDRCIAKPETWSRGLRRRHGENGVSRC
jgi:hypothetical protein